ncbi:hypothetical protein E4U41_004261 [Claviceps citrina]|nr:hypothetical protein E4U41_004261 [Claviceps citrina]
MPSMRADNVIGTSDHKDTKAAEEYKTDLSRWRLNVDQGRHMWEYLGVSDNANSANGPKSRPQSFLEKYWLGQKFSLPSMPSPTRPSEALDNGWEFFKRLQTEDGHWSSNDDGPLFVTGGIVISSYIIGIPLPESMRNEIIRYALNFAHVDGGWAMWIDTPPTVFGTAINYVMLRILGLPPTHPVLVEARRALHRMGSAKALPTWGKLWMCVLGVYEWDGMLPLIPEPFLTPRFLPLNPGNWWVHVRNVYASMSYLYGHRFAMTPTPLTEQLRQELYDVPYESIDWIQQRGNISTLDRLSPATLLQKGLSKALYMYEAWKIKYLRRMALDKVLFQVEAKVRNTNYLSIAAVTFASNLLVLFHAHGRRSH